MYRYHHRYHKLVCSVHVVFASYLKKRAFFLDNIYNVNQVSNFACCKTAVKAHEKPKTKQNKWLQAMSRGRAR